MPEPATRTGVRREASGYAHASYARSLDAFGTPRRLPASGGWILERPIPGIGRCDAMSCYPFFSCVNADGLSEDLAGLDNDIISLTMVIDPFGGFSEMALRAAFPDVCRPFKEHFVTDLSRSPDAFVDAHHRRNARKGLAVLDVACCEPADAYLDAWCRLYAVLVERHGIQGITAFSRAAFARQLRAPGIVAMRADLDGVAVGMVLWYVFGDVAYYHLGAYDAEGYDRRASFALFARSLALFADRGVRWLSLGAGAGVRGDADDGLTRFKRGWATGTRTAYLCGKVFDRAAYDALCEGRPEGGYFPLYRSGEFGNGADAGRDGQ